MARNGELERSFSCVFSHLLRHYIRHAPPNTKTSTITSERLLLIGYFITHHSANFSGMIGFDVRGLGHWHSLDTALQDVIFAGL